MREDCMRACKFSVVACASNYATRICRITIWPWDLSLDSDILQSTFRCRRCRHHRNNGDKCKNSERNFLHFNLLFECGEVCLLLKDIGSVLALILPGEIQSSQFIESRAILMCSSGKCFASDNCVLEGEHFVYTTIPLKMSHVQYQKSCSSWW